MTLASVDPLTRELDAARRAAAERAERERQAAFELRLAADVQARLLPQTAPPIARLDCAGACRQARRIGGDHYDFLDGVTEALDAGGSEFGEERLVDAVRATGNVSAAALVEAVCGSVGAHGGAERYDDLTVIVAAAG